MNQHTSNLSRVTIHMVSSLDGFIAKKDGDISWLTSKDHYEKGATLSDEDIEAFLRSIDCYVMGSRTYEQALQLGWPYGEVPVVVLTHRALTSDRKTVDFYAGDPGKLINDRLKPKYRNIWMVGGASIAKDLIRRQLADEIVLSVMPVILGNGTLFFDYIDREQLLHLKDVNAYQDGMVELSYEIKKD